MQRPKEGVREYPPLAKEMPTLQKEPKTNKAPESLKSEACATLNFISKISNMQCLEALAPCPREASISQLLA